MHINEFMMNKNKQFDTWVLNIILLLYPVEQFSVVHFDHILGAFSPFRMVILPLCVLYLVSRSGRGIKSTNLYMIGVYVFFGFAFVFITMSGTPASSLSFVGSIIQFAMAYCLIRNLNFQKSTLYIITTWCMIQVPSLFVAYSTHSLGMAQRFSGLFFDPNYLCAFVDGAIVSAAHLYSIEKSKLLRVYNLIVIIFGLMLLFLSYSRGGLLGLIIVGLVYLFVYNKKLMLIVIGIAIPIISALMIRAQFLTWQDGADNIFDGFLYRTLTLSRDVDELTAGRSDYAEEFLKHVDEYLFTGTDVFTYLDKYNGGHFVHNGFLEILIQGGIIVGAIFLLVLLYAIVKEIIMANQYHRIAIEILICIAILIPLTTLSYTSKVSWLCMGIIISMASKIVFKERSRSMIK